jgi:dTDP-4-amino-4,6-dideoxygalactose transaminase
MLDQIPFNRPFIAGKELFYMANAVVEGHLAGRGTYARRCEAWFQEHFAAQHVLLTHTCTSALELAALLAEVGPGDEVILPSFTFVSTANAFALRGAELKFVDIRPDTLNVDEEAIAAAVTPRTRVICPVHYAGVACAMDEIMDLANSHDLLVIEDAAQGVGATYGGRHLGTIGHLGCYSFHETKNLISGEGGALLINDPDMIERAEIAYEKGTNRTRFLQGETDRYVWVGLGSSYAPSELVAAFLYAQLEEVGRITRDRRAVFDLYRQAFQPYAERGMLRLPHTPVCCEHNAHMFYLILPSQAARDHVIASLRHLNIHAVFHFVPLHSSPMAAKLGCDVPDLPVTEDLSSRLLRLPCYFGLTREDQERVIAGVMGALADLPNRQLVPATAG